MLRSAGKRLISQMGFEVITASNGAEAAAAYRLHRDEIALVILDVAMPVMSGAECFQRLRELDPQVCVLIASGYARHGDVDTLLAAGAAGYLGKPYDRRELQSAIRQALNLAQSGSIAISSTPPMGSTGAT
jgi:CheY-like chemotaxis protein